MAYADPPYPGRCCGTIYRREGTPEFHPDSRRWEDPAAHVQLMLELDCAYPDGWALSTHSGALRDLLPGAPTGAKIGAYCKPGEPVQQIGQPTDPSEREWASSTHMWEPVIYRVPIRARVGVRPPADWVSDQPAGFMAEEFKGAKPPKFCRWLFRLLRLGAHPADELVDMFPGSGAVGRAWDEYRVAQASTPSAQRVLPFSAVAKP